MNDGSKIYYLKTSAPDNAFAYVKDGDGRWYLYDQDFKKSPHGQVFDSIDIGYFNCPSIVCRGGMYGVLDMYNELVIPLQYISLEYSHGILVGARQMSNDALCYEYYCSVYEECIMRTTKRLSVVYYFYVGRGTLLVKDNTNTYYLRQRHKNKLLTTKLRDTLVVERLSGAVYHGQGHIVVVSYDEISHLAKTDFLQVDDRLDLITVNKTYFYLRVQRGELWMLLGQDGNPLLPDWADGVVPLEHKCRDGSTVAHTALVRHGLQTTVVHLPTTVIE